MNKPVEDPEFWKARLQETMDTRPKELYRSVLNLTRPVMDRAEAAHRTLLRAVVQDATAVLDVGCGIGRILDCLPTSWRGNYLGIDISPELLDAARRRHPKKDFVLCRAQDVRRQTEGTYDVAIACSFKSMIVANVGEETWQKMRSAVLECAEMLVILEIGDPFRMEVEVGCAKSSVP